MIPRYSRPNMVAIWSPETKFRIWYEIEAHACDAMADLITGIVSSGPLRLPGRAYGLSLKASAIRCHRSSI